MNRPKRWNIALLILLLLASFPTLAGNKTKFGFSTEATISGLFTPKLKRVKIAEVLRDSPAFRAGLLVGDLIIEANGKTIEGAPAREMAAQLRALKPGEHLRLRVKRNQEFASIDIIAGSE